MLDEPEHWCQNDDEGRESSSRFENAEGNHDDDDDDGAAKVSGKMEASKRRKLRNPDADMHDIEKSYPVTDSSPPRNPWRSDEDPFSFLGRVYKVSFAW